MKWTAILSNCNFYLLTPFSQLSELPYESVTTAWSKPLFEAVQATLEVMEFLPEFLNYLEAAGKQKKQNRRGTKQPLESRLGAGYDDDDYSSTELNLEDLLKDFGDSDDNNPLASLMIAEGSRMPPKRKKVLNRVIDLDELDPVEGHNFMTAGSDDNKNDEEDDEDGWSSVCLDGE